ncbi:MAG: nitrate reductase cytochrome c-type subunit, partial [Spirochaetota bacterium]|nr:nitrate reductase cytochrome c-type subunit [Spirochaetota bacterium]
MLRLIITAYTILLTVTLIIACGDGKGVSDKSLGLRKTSVFDEKGTTTPGAKYSKTGPGQSKKIARSFENAPPMIPHSTENFLPITKGNNMCLQCHMPAMAKATKATPIPKSHLYDLRKKRDQAGKLDQS